MANHKRRGLKNKYNDIMTVFYIGEKKYFHLILSEKIRYTRTVLLRSETSRVTRLPRKTTSTYISFVFRSSPCTLLSADASYCGILLQCWRDDCCRIVFSHYYEGTETLNALETLFFEKRVVMQPLMLCIWQFNLFDVKLFEGSKQNFWSMPNHSKFGKSTFWKVHLKYGL